jgi:hypothetical protein
MARPIQTTTATPTTAASTMTIRPRRADRAVGSGPYRPAGGRAVDCSGLSSPASGRAAGDSVTTVLVVVWWRDAGAA